MKVFAGIEGGATHSKGVLIDETGRIVASVDGGSLNYLVSDVLSYSRVYLPNENVSS